MINIKTILVCVLLSATSTAQATIYKFSPTQGRIVFLAKGRPALISIQGEGEGGSGELTLKDDQLNGEISFRIDALKTGIELRDEHMKKKYLQSETYPMAHLRILKAGLPKGFSSGELSFKGILNLHGIEREVSIDAKVSSEGGVKKITSEFVVKLSDFKIEIPSFKGITVAEDVKIKVETSPVVVQ